MTLRTASWMLGLGFAVVLAGCADAQNKVAGNVDSLAGWYMQHAGAGSFQPCGDDSKPWPVTGKADLDTRARAFGLEEDTPVYVKLLAKKSVATDGSTVIDVEQVQQFGSPEPVKNCALTGVVIPAPASTP